MFYLSFITEFDETFGFNLKKIPLAQVDVLRNIRNRQHGISPKNQHKIYETTK